MKLEDIVNNTEPTVTAAESILGAADVLERRGTCAVEDVSVLTADSRAVRPGGIFVAVRGVTVDGHRFIAKAIEAGASVIVAEEFPDTLPDGVLFVRVADSREALGRMASRYYGEPSDELRLVGVTGTNGKTTIATLLYDMARMRGEKAGLISTVAVKIDGEEYPSDHTTPDPILLNACLRRMADAGCTFASMEVSSHAADQHRIAGLNFAGGIFTNLTRDHLDYHKTFDAYLRAKKSFFDLLPADAFALSNADDRNGAVMLQNTAARRAFYSVRDAADFHVRVIEDRIDGMLLDFAGREVETMFTGSFNASNLAAVYGAAVLLGVPADEAGLLMSRLHPVAGRFQPFRSADGITAIVDYAHTPDALINVLDTIREVAPEGSSVITVCGCGGDRDPGKRPQMAKAAAVRSDILVITSDNPRSEDPQAIINDMLAGLDEFEKGKTHCHIDRREAIREAVALAEPGDIILIAGKGHETTQTLASGPIHFDDREEIVAAFRSKVN